MAETLKRTDESARAQGIAHFERREWLLAIRCFEHAIQEDPSDATLLNYRARALDAAGRADEALKDVDRCLALQPRSIADLRNRALLLVKLSRPQEALASLDALLELAPGHIDVLIRRAVLLFRLDRRDEALQSVQRAVSVAPKDPNALNTRGMMLDAFGRHDEALRDFERALTLQPDFADAINNRGIHFARCGRFEEALACYERSLTLAPEQPQTLYNRAMTRLALGDWARGFREFESRWSIFPHEAMRLKRLAPVWLGQCPVAGKTVLLHHEQGYGDTLQFSRYVPLVIKLGARVILAVPAALTKLMGTLPGNPQIVCEGAAIPAHDYCCALMSLPLIFETTPETVPASVPYLHADPHRVGVWGRRLGARARVRIGLVWSGRRYAPVNHPRDMALEVVSALFTLEADFICLQTELSQQERSELGRWPNVSCPAVGLTDFADTAALIENLDLVISVDTAVTHLAGALGKPVWLMNRYASCWRWLQKRPDSAWYPTLRQFRQRSMGDWAGVVEEVRGAAISFIGQDRARRTCALIEAEPVHPTPVPPLTQVLQQALADHRDGRLSQAISGYREALALQGNLPEVLHLLGTALAQTGSFDEAVTVLSKAVAQQPERAPIHNHLGNALSGLSRFEEALVSYERAIALDARFADAYYNRGVVLMQQDQLERALACYLQAIRLRPDYAQAHNNCGNVLLELDRLGEALAFYERAIALRSDFGDAWVNRANLLRRLGRYEEGLASCEHALRWQPEQAEAHSAMGAILANIGRYEQALQSYQRSLQLRPTLSEGLWNKALLHLSRGEFSQGWPLYEARWKVKSLHLSHRCNEKPPWLGRESLEGRVILLHAEQGYGDTIQFCRYAPLVSSLGAKVILGVPGALQTLMTSLEGVDQVVTQGKIPAFEHHCPLLSLPLALGTQLNSIPATTPYLRADAVSQQKWELRLGRGSIPRIGLAWSGKPTHTNDANRSIAFAQLLPLLECDAEFVSLQKEVRASDEALLAQTSRIHRWGEELADFSDTAALISALDLIICVDTSIVHLAGALGKPVWILLPHVADWRWLQQRTDSPWYPSARLFRQAAPRNWSEVINQVVVNLKTFLSRRRGAPQRSPKVPRGQEVSGAMRVSARN